MEQQDSDLSGNAVTLQCLGGGVKETLMFRFLFAQVYQCNGSVFKCIDLSLSDQTALKLLQLDS